jgi:hypothetical protein
VAFGASRRSAAGDEKARSDAGFARYQGFIVDFGLGEPIM